jgi:hypothetical protein
MRAPGQHPQVADAPVEWDREVRDGTQVAGVPPDQGGEPDDGQTLGRRRPQLVEHPLAGPGTLEHLLRGVGVLLAHGRGAGPQDLRHLPQRPGGLGPRPVQGGARGDQRQGQGHRAADHRVGPP